MLLAYLDEIGEPGAFVAKDHSRFNTSPAFGYAGFVIPASNARFLGQQFTHTKRTLFSTELLKVADPGKWEKKGADIFRPSTATKYAHQLRAFNGLVNRLRSNQGHVFFTRTRSPSARLIRSA